MERWIVVGVFGPVESMNRGGAGPVVTLKIESRGEHQSEHICCKEE